MDNFRLVCLTNVVAGDCLVRTHYWSDSAKQSTSDSILAAFTELGNAPSVTRLAVWESSRDGEREAALVLYDCNGTPAEHFWLFDADSNCLEELQKIFDMLGKASVKEFRVFSMRQCF